MAYVRRMIVVPLLALAACQQQPDQNDGTEDRDESISSPIVDEEGSVMPDPAGNAAVADRTEEDEDGNDRIPAGFRGRWGMVPADCGPDKGAAKGLLTINGEMLRFYESVARPASVSRPAPDRLEGRFAFTGEGMDWSKDMSLALKDDGATLVRSERDPEASYTYRRCTS